MIQAVNQPVVATQTNAKRSGVFVLSLKIGTVIAFIHTLIISMGIWSYTPSKASIIATAGSPGVSGLLLYKLNMLIGAAIWSLILWFVVALALIFVMRQFKKG